MKLKELKHIFLILVIFSFFCIGEGGLFWITPAQAAETPTIQITATGDTTDTITVTFTQAIPATNIIDVELHNSNDQKVWQDFTTNGGTTFTTKTTIPLTDDTYTVAVGLFAPNWQNTLSWYGNLAKIAIPGNTVTLAATTPSPTPTQITGQQDTYTAAMNAYSNWKSTYVQQANVGGERVVRPENNQDTVSEGMGYGMLLSAFAKDQSTFSQLWQYAQKFLDSNGLMNWDIDNNGHIIGGGAATDADEDMAYALILASKQWPGQGYDTAATNMITAIKQHEVNGQEYITPGDTWGNTQDMNPSYLAISHYRAFAQFTGNTTWNDIANTNMQWLTRAANSNTGLVPDWLKNDTSPTTDIAWDTYPHAFYYDALRTPIRLLLTYKLDNDTTAQTILQKEATFLASINNDKLTAGYTVWGNPLTNYQDTAFLAAYTAAAQVDPTSSFAQQELQKLETTTPSGYFGTSLRAITLFIAAGVTQ